MVSPSNPQPIPATSGLDERTSVFNTIPRLGRLLWDARLLVSLWKSVAGYPNVMEERFWAFGRQHRAFKVGGLSGCKIND